MGWSLQAVSPLRLFKLLTKRLRYLTGNNAKRHAYLITFVSACGGGGVGLLCESLSRWKQAKIKAFSNLVIMRGHAKLFKTHWNHFETEAHVIGWQFVWTHQPSRRINISLSSEVLQRFGWGNHPARNLRENASKVFFQAWVWAQLSRT